MQFFSHPINIPQLQVYDIRGTQSQFGPQKDNRQIPFSLHSSQVDLCKNAIQFLCCQRLLDFLFPGNGDGKQPLKWNIQPPGIPQKFMKQLCIGENISQTASGDFFGTGEDKTGQIGCFIVRTSVIPVLRR